MTPPPRVYRDANFGDDRIGLACSMWYHETCARNDGNYWEPMAEGGAYVPDEFCRCARCASRDYSRTMRPYLSDPPPAESMHFL